MTVEELLLYDSTTRKKAPTEVRAILRYMKKKGGEKPLPEAGKEKDGIRRLRPGAIPQSFWRLP